MSDAGQLLARTSRRFESGQVDPDIARKVRESLLSASTSGRPKEAGPTSAIDGLKIVFRRNDRGSGHAGNCDLCLNRRRFQGLSESFQALCESALASLSIPWSECPGTCR